MVDTASTVIGESILVNGNLQGDEHLTVLGRVHGSINLTKTLVVEQSGIVKADVSVRNAIISGIIVGNIEASDSVELTESGRVVGDIHAPRIIIVDGARFRGTIDMGDLEAPRSSGAVPTRTIDRSSFASRSTAMTRATPSVKPSSTTSVPRRAPPPPPTRIITSAAPAKSKAPVPTKKKIKKKVVAKKKR
ncbi:MAG: polymer-forming cytoskeletal protein [Myxococcota bacterium]